MGTRTGSTKISWDVIEERLNQLPRVKLATLPTPLEPMPRLSAKLGGPRLYIKRDDLTGLAFGGNKARKLEFLMAEVLAQGCSSIITYAAAQSNYCRQVAAAAAKLGIRAHFVLFKSVHNEWQGNLLLDELFGADIHWVEGDFAVAAAAARALEQELHVRDEKPYLADLLGPTVPVVFPAYLFAAHELYRQCVELEIAPEWVVLTSGSGVTHSSLALGLKMLGSRTQVLGISIRKADGQGREDILSWAESSAAALDLPITLQSSEVYYSDDYRGEGYARPTPQTLEAIRLVAQTEGILLDPVYTGKAMAGLIAEIRKGTFTRDQTVVFLHTGGAPALFAYHSELHATNEWC